MKYLKTCSHAKTMLPVNAIAVKAANLSRSTWKPGACMYQETTDNYGKQILSVVNSVKSN